MGTDKSRMQVGGAPMAARLAALLRAWAEPVVEVGPGSTDLTAVREDPPGSGPLAAVAAGGEALAGLGHLGPALVVACDLPLLGSAAIGLLAQWPGTTSVVPVVEGRPQPLCARWSAAHLRTAGVLVARGARSMGALLAVGRVELIGESRWSGAVEAASFADVDQPSDLARLGLRRDAPPSD